MTGSTRGILYPARLPRFHRLPAPGVAAHLVQWFWVPEWDLEPGRTSRQHVVAYPASNLVVEPGLVGLAGPTTRRSHRDLAGKGWAVGALLRPAAVPSFTADPATLRDAYVALDLPDLRDLVAEVMAADGRPDGGSGGRDGDARRARAVDLFSCWLADRVGEVPDEAHLANAMADLIDTSPEVQRIEDAAARLAVSPRTLQRLARRYIGLPPAAMIRRRRLQEAAERVRTEPDGDLAAIAADLGYSDHAHLTNDFRTVLGFTPSGYRRDAG